MGCLNLPRAKCSVRSPRTPRNHGGGQGPVIGDPPELACTMTAHQFLCLWKSLPALFLEFSVTTGLQPEASDVTSIRRAIARLRRPNTGPCRHHERRARWHGTSDQTTRVLYRLDDVSERAVCLKYLYLLGFRVASRIFVCCIMLGHRILKCCHFLSSRRERVFAINLRNRSAGSFTFSLPAASAISLCVKPKM